MKRITINTPIRFHDPLPDAADVAIIGGGVIGVFAALYLARAGKKVVLCEKGRIAGEQSSRNWGWIRQQGRDEAELPIAMRAVNLWKEVDADLRGACGMRVSGTTYMAKTEAEAAEYQDWIKLAATYGLESEFLSREAVGALFGGHAAPGWIAGLHTASDARAEPWQAVPAVAGLAQSEGALLRENCAVRGLDISAGRVTGIITEEGRIACDQVILAGGAWSGLFARRHGVSIPQLTLRGTVVQTAPLPQVFAGLGCDDALGLRRREDGGYTLALVDRHSYLLGPDGFRHAFKYLPLLSSAWRSLDIWPAQPRHFPDCWRTPRDWSIDATSPFERMRVLEPEPSRKQVERIARRFAARFPSLGQPKVANAWAGMIDAMPDVIPIVDRAERPQGLILATGMSAHGFGIGPGYGEILAQMVCDEAVPFDMARFRISRFTDGTQLKLGPEL